MHVSVVHTHLDMYKDTRARCQVSSFITSYLITLRQGLLMNLKLSIWGFLFVGSF